MSVRLRGSLASNKGRVEVYYAGKWGTINRYNWDLNDATVVCRQLGYSTALMAGYGLFCSAAVPEWFRNFKCYGNESSLDQCTWDFLTISSYASCANVMCKDKIPAGTSLGGVLTAYMTGGSGRASFCEPKKYMCLKFYIQKNTWHQNFLPPKYVICDKH